MHRMASAKNSPLRCAQVMTGCPRFIARRKVVVTPLPHARDGRPPYSTTVLQMETVDREELIDDAGRRGVRHDCVGLLDRGGPSVVKDIIGNVYNAAAHVGYIQGATGTNVLILPPNEQQILLGAIEPADEHVIGRLATVPVRRPGTKGPVIGAADDHLHSRLGFPKW